MKTAISQDPGAARHGSLGVYQQQGRMFTDADWNAWVVAFGVALEASLEGVAPAGSPRLGGALENASADEPTSRWGKVFAGGAQAHLAPADGIVDSPFEFGRQADLPAAPPPPADRPVNLYLDLWERPITVLEDPTIADPGLGGGDTCTRTRAMAQVKWCEAELDPEVDLPRVGNAHLTLKLRGLSLGLDPCDPCAAEVPLDEEVGDYLFRVEVHDAVADDAGVVLEVTLKWSRENGAVQQAYDAPGAGITGEGWLYEWFDADTERLAGVDPAAGYRPQRGRLTTSPVRPEAPPDSWLRRWDGYCVLTREGGVWRLTEGRDMGVGLSEGRDPSSHGRVEITDATVTLSLEQLEMRLGDTLRPFGGGRFLAGDYWTADLRNAVHASGDQVLGDIAGGVPPVGVRHGYLHLGRLEEGALVVDPDESRRLSFPSLADLHARDLALDEPLPPLLADLNNVRQALELLGGIGGGLSSDRVTHAIPSCPRPDPVRNLLALDPGASDISAVLNRILCGLGAASLPVAKLQGLCGTLARPDVRSVQHGLKRLCFQNGRRDCAVTVGVGGDHTTLVEAVTAIGDAPELDLALLPGVHDLDSLTLEGRRQLRIRGAGSQASLLEIRDRLSLDAEELELEGLGVKLDQDAETIDLRGREVHARCCAFEQELGQEHQSWLQRYDTGYQADAVATDALGNLVFGGLRHTGIGGRTSNPANQEGFVLRMGPRGEVLWFHPIGHTVRSVALDSAGNVLALGGCNDGDDLGDGVPVARDGDYVVKLDPDGGYLWSKAFGTGSSFRLTGGVALDEADNVLVAGAFNGRANFAGAQRTASSGVLGSRTDIYVVKLDSNGERVWVQTYGTASSNDVAKADAVDALGNVYVCGEIQNPLDFGGPTLPSDADKFVLKLSPEGEHLWSRGFEGGGDADSIAIDEEGNVSVAGVITTEMVVSGRRIGQRNLNRPYVLQIDVDGQDRWGIAFASSSGSGSCRSVAVEGLGRVWVAGHFQGEMDFGGGPDAIDPRAPVLNRAFLVGLSIEGEYLQSHTFPGLSFALGMVAATGGPLAGSVLMTGKMEGPVTLGGRTLNYPHSFDNVAFFMKVSGLDAGAPVVRVSPGERGANLRWAGNRMLAHHQEPQEIPEGEELAGISFVMGSPRLLELAGRHLGGWIGDNRIEGEVLLSDGESESSPEPGDPEVPPPSTADTHLHLEGNRLHRLVCIQDQGTQATEESRSLTLRGNGFESPDSRLVAANLSLIGNRFSGGEGSAPVVAVAKSGTAVYTGNQARNPGAVLRRHQEVGSSEEANLLTFEDV